MVVADFLTPMSGQFSLSSNTLKTRQNPAGPDDLISGVKNSGAILPGFTDLESRRYQIPLARIGFNCKGPCLFTLLSNR